MWYNHSCCTSSPPSTCIQSCLSRLLRLMYVVATSSLMLWLLNKSQMKRPRSVGQSWQRRQYWRSMLSITAMCRSKLTGVLGAFIDRGLVATLYVESSLNVASGTILLMFIGFLPLLSYETIVCKWLFAGTILVSFLTLSLSFFMQLFIFKIVLLGDSGVAKSNHVFHFTKNEFNKDSKSTIGVEFATKTVQIEDNKLVKAQIWDTAGQEWYQSIALSYYRGAVGAELVYDVTDRNSFNHVPMWFKEVKENTEKDCLIISCWLEIRLIWMTSKP